MPMPSYVYLFDDWSMIINLSYIILHTILAAQHNLAYINTGTLILLVKVLNKKIA